jgi:hypothetical protein
VDRPRRPLRAGAWAAVALVLLAACGSTGGDDDEGLRSGGNGEPSAPSAAAEPTPLRAEDVDRWRAVWERSAPEAYRYVITATCGCDWAGTFEVTVVGDEVVSVDAPEAPAGERHRRWFGQTVEAMFGMFEEALLVAAEERSTAEARAAFDREQGHPVAFAVRWMAPDEPYQAEISAFEAIDASEVEERPAGVPLSLTNQSFEHPDAHVTVTVAGEVLVDTVLPVQSQHHVVTYGLPLAPGRHELLFTSDAGARHTEVVEVRPGEPLFLSASHWTAEDATQAPARFDVQADDQPPVYG